MTDPSPSHKPRLLTAEESLNKVRISRSEFYRAIRSGRIPKPIKQGRRSFWSAADIDTFIDNLLAGRSAPNCNEASDARSIM